MLRWQGLSDESEEWLDISVPPSGAMDRRRRPSRPGAELAGCWPDVAARDLRLDLKAAGVPAFLATLSALASL